MLRGRRDILLLGLALATAAGCASAASDDTTSTSAIDTSDAAVDVPGDAAAADAAAPPRGPSPTAMAADLAAIGLDVGNLPALDDLPMAKKMKVMRTFNKAMGITCNACHDLSDYSLPTPQKEAAMTAWDTIVRGMAIPSPDGGAPAPLYCDSCHYGKFKFLDRSDRPRLMQWMSDNFVHTLVHKDGSPMGCLSCHKTDPTAEPDAGSDAASSY